MAKDDYPVLVAKILVFLYRKLKEKTDIKAEDYIMANTKDFPISEQYLSWVLKEMSEKGLIRGFSSTRVWGGEDIRISSLNDIEITADGIEYLSSNGTIKKVIGMIPQAASIAELFI